MWPFSCPLMFVQCQLLPPASQDAARVNSVPRLVKAMGDKRRGVKAWAGTMLGEFQQCPVEEGAKVLDRLQQHSRMRSVVSLIVSLMVLWGIMVESLRPVLASTKPAPGGQRTTHQQPFNTALFMTMGSGVEQHGIKTTARQLGVTPHAVKRARRSPLSNLAAGAAADWTAARLRTAVSARSSWSTCTTYLRSTAVRHPCTRMCGATTCV
ncbi:hypothetical protein HaLaN_10442 [Haematococcus lacustris]|uniref:Uncharacterized protein n=1 Tax=Haematococcus lacustris TaxID=44745 RepID=A0A699Z537_HAELA|nr:hypothetical protein HaLaN_10442 [Haematococcus lacustris]